MDNMSAWRERVVATLELPTPSAYLDELAQEGMMFFELATNHQRLDECQEIVAIQVLIFGEKRKRQALEKRKQKKKVKWECETEEMKA
jgi:succinylarginine dihydrolase